MTKHKISTRGGVSSASPNIITYYIILVCGGPGLGKGPGPQIRSDMKAQRDYGICGEALHQQSTTVNLEKASISRVQQLIREKLEELKNLQWRHTKLTGSRFGII